VALAMGPTDEEEEEEHNRDGAPQNYAFQHSL